MSEEKPGSCIAGSESPQPGAVSDALTLDGRIITRFVIERCRAASQLLASTLPTVADYCNKHRAAGRMWPIWNEQELYPLKLLELWGILNREKPQRILELGTGCTTAVFAQYCRDNSAELVTVDENADFQAAVLKDVAGKHIVAIHSQVRRWDNCCEYSDLMPSEFDFVYVDGPANGKAICLDAAKFRPPVIAFDIRRETVAYMMEGLAGYSWELSCWQKIEPWYLSRMQHHTVARKQ